MRLVDHDAVDRHLDLPGEQVGGGGSGAPIGDVHHVHPGGLLEQLARQMAGCANARAREIDLRRVFSGVVDQLFQAPGGHVLVDDEHTGQDGQLRDRGQIIDRIVGQPRHQVRVGHLRPWRRIQQGVSVGRGLGHEVRAQGGAPSGLVVHDDGLPQPFAQGAGNGTCHDVGPAARRERHHQAQGAIRVVLRVGGERYERQQQGQAGSQHVRSLSRDVVFRPAGPGPAGPGCCAGSRWIRRRWS